MDNFLITLETFLEPGSIILLIIILLIINSWIFKKLKTKPSDAFVGKKSISFLLIFAGILAFILSLPIDKSLKGQILSFLGIIFSAGIALSSTTVLGNLIAGIMNNSMKRFRNGDLIKINELQGRVVEKSIFHIEIQLEDSNFVTIPNLFIASNPVKLTRKTNTVISTSVSLGYDVPRLKIEEALKKAALMANLKDPYVYITQLGDYSVVYKIHGFLEDSGKFFSTTSILNAKVMDVLHENGIEIVSPSFMNQRRTDKTIFIPKKHEPEKPEIAEKTPEELIFEDAIKAEKTEKKKDYLLKLENKLEEIKAKIKESNDEDEIVLLKSSLDHIDELKQKIEISIINHNKDK